MNDSALSLAAAADKLGKHGSINEFSLLQEATGFWSPDSQVYPVQGTPLWKSVVAQCKAWTSSSAMDLSPLRAYLR